jgi:hypothetical protein
MTKLLITAIVFFVTTLFFSCKKNTNSANNYYIKMKIDNKDFSFSDSLYATKQLSSPELIIFGYSKTQGQLQWLFSDFSSGTYFDTYDTSVKKVIYQFTINAIVKYYNNAPVIEQLLRPNPTVSNPISMTITNVNSNYVEGTFNGTLSNGSTATSNITNGQFKIPFK